MTTNDTEAALVEHIQSLVLEFVHETNSRNLEALRPKMAPDFKADFSSNSGLDVDRCIAWHNDVYTRHPDFRLNILEPAIVDLEDCQQGIVRALSRFEIHGAPPGMIIPGMNEYEFQEIDAQWLLLSVKSMRVGALEE